MRYLVSILIGCLAGCLSLKAQVDPHFSQYYAYPLWLNPALTGAIDGDYRVSANYRNQWANISNPFSTVGLSGDFVTDKNVNLGVNILHQSAGNGGYQYMNASVSVAYTGVRMGTDGYQRLVFALQGGLLNKRFDPSKFEFGDQWNPVTGYNPANPTGDILNRNSYSAFDASAGVLYIDEDPFKNANLFGGFSATHLTRPQDPFLSGSDARMPIRYTLHGGVRLVASETINITPNALYMRQGNASEKMLGAYMQVIASPTTDVLAGMYYRFNDAVVPFAGFHYKNFVVGLSFDANASRLKQLARASNSFEISLSFIGKKATVFPKEYFFCPRL